MEVISNSAVVSKTLAHSFFEATKQRFDNVQFGTRRKNGIAGRRRVARSRHFEQAGQSVTPEAARGKVACGPDPARHIEMISKYKDAGYDHIWAHQIGSDQDSFFDFYAREVLPKLDG